MQLMLQVAFFSLDYRSHMGVLHRFLLSLELIDVVKIACDKSTIQRLLSTRILNGLSATISHNWLFNALLGIFRLKVFVLSLTDVMLDSLDVSIESRLNHIKLLFHVRFWFALLF